MLKVFCMVGGVCKDCALAAQNLCLSVVLSSAKFLNADVVVQKQRVYTQSSGSLTQFIPTENSLNLHLPEAAFPHFTQPLLKQLRSI